MMFVALAGSGCSAAEDVASGGSGDGGALDEGGDLARLAAAICERQAACGCEPPPSDDLDQLGCEALHYEGLHNLAAEAAEADDYSFDEACLRELADCWEQLECGQSYEDAVLCAPSCAVHHMNLGVGSECDDEPNKQHPTGFVRQCEPGLTCLGGHGFSLCDTPAPLEVGESCHDGALHRSCASDLYCSWQESDQGECQPRVGEGSACESSSACITGLRCHVGTCAPLGEPGEECSSDSDCETDLRCHPIDAVCTALAGIDEVCRFPTNYGEELLPCVEGAWCGEEHCEPPLDLGAPCKYSDGCPLGSTCDDGRCTACADDSCSVRDPVCTQIPLGYCYPRPPE